MGLTWNICSRDFPADILHDFLLGWTKKAVGKLKDEYLSTRDLANVCAILDKSIIWKVIFFRNGNGEICWRIMFVS